MLPGMRLGLLLLPLTFSTIARAHEVGADGIFDVADRLPTCGRDCFMPSIPLTSCAITNGTCLCLDSTFQQLAAACLGERCSPVDILTTLRLESEGCRREKRSRKWSLLIPLVCEIPAWLFLWIRLYSRWSLHGRWELDDWLMLPAGACYTVFLICSHYSGHMAYGVDMWTLTPAQVTQSSKYFYISDLFNLAALALAKASMLWFYVRVFPPNKHFRRLVYASIAFTALPAVTLIFLKIFKCMPVHAAWDGWMNTQTPAHCLDSQALQYVSAGLNIAQDLLIFLLPVASLLRLKVDNRSRWGIVLMFSLGAVILVTSCVRLSYIASYGTANNASWEFTDTIIWTGLELAVVVIVACLPAIWLLARRVLPMASSPDRSDHLRQPSDEGQRVGRLRLVFGAKKARQADNESEYELGLDLGDRRGGRVRTHISTYRLSFDDCSAGNEIRIDTTMTMTTLVTASKTDGLSIKTGSA